MNRQSYSLEPRSYQGQQQSYGQEDHFKSLDNGYLTGKASQKGSHGDEEAYGSLDTIDNNSYLKEQEAKPVKTERALKEADGEYHGRAGKPQRPKGSRQG